MQTIKNDNERKPKSVGEAMESLTKTKKRVTKSILNNTGAFVSFFLVAVAIIVLTTNVEMSSAIEWVELSLTLFILMFCSYSMYINLANSGTKAAKLGDAYIETDKKFNDTKKIIKDGKMQMRGVEFCHYWSNEELKNTRSQFLDEVGIDYDIYKKQYIGKSKEELQEIEGLTESQIEAIVAANNTKAIKLTLDMFYKSGRGSNGRKPLGISPETKRKIAYSGKFVTTLITTLLTGIVVLKLIADPSWATFAECCLKILPIILNGFMGYEMGYKNIAVDTVNYMSDQIDLMEQLIEYVRQNPVPQVIEDDGTANKSNIENAQETKTPEVKEEKKPQPPPLRTDPTQRKSKSK